VTQTSDVATCSTLSGDSMLRRPIHRAVPRQNHALELLECIRIVRRIVSRHRRHVRSSSCFRVEHANT
jgi:hypothetical protein